MTATSEEHGDGEEQLAEFEERRMLRGSAAVVVTIVAVLFSAYQLWLAARGFTFAIPIPGIGTVRIAALQPLQVNAVHVVFGLILTFLLFPPVTGNGLTRRLGLVRRTARRLGENHPITGILRRLRKSVRWVISDPDRERITPVDIVLILIAVAIGLYMLNDFKEIRQLRVLGIDGGRPIHEVFPFLDAPVQLISALGLPLDETSYAFILGALGVLLVLEATRRALGVYLMAIVASFILYARFGYLIPSDAPYISVLATVQATDPWANIVQNLWFNTEQGVFGVPISVSVSFVYIFILFGAFLETGGVGQWFIDLAYAATGRRTGGPAKASVLASGFMGTISGSSVANTVTTGTFTIPLMKRSGYRAEFAGAVEAAASSGGQILPPVMGAAAFLMIEYTGIAFRNIIIAATIPAVVFFVGVWVMVHLEAVREDITGMNETDSTDPRLISLRSHLRQGWFYVLPIVLLLYYLLVVRLSVSRAAWFTLLAIVAVIAVVAAYNERNRVVLFASVGGLFVLETIARVLTGTGIVSAVLSGGQAGPGVDIVSALFGTVTGSSFAWLVIGLCVIILLVRPHADAPLLAYDESVEEATTHATRSIGRPSLSENGAFRFGSFVLKAMENGARTATVVVVALAAAGIIPGVVSATGLGPNLVALIKAVAGGSLVLLLLITAVASIILGMGMPTTVTYIILVSLLGTALTDFGIPILAAHLFILYFGVIADITPPVAVAAYAASGVAKSDSFQTGVEAFSLSLNKAIVPFAFVFAPGILLLRETGQVIGLSDVTDIGYFVPEVVIPVVGLFVGVVALGPTVIGYLYTRVSNVERALFGVSALLLMAPGLLLHPLGLAGGSVFDLGLRGVGLILFFVLVLKNRHAPHPERTAHVG